MARVSVFFKKASKSDFFCGGEGKGGLAGVSEFVLHESKSIFFSLQGGGGGGGGERGAE